MKLIIELKSQLSRW